MGYFVLGYSALTPFRLMFYVTCSDDFGVNGSLHMYVAALKSASVRSSLIAET